MSVCTNSKVHYQHQRLVCPLETGSASSVRISNFACQFVLDESLQKQQITASDQCCS